MIRFCTGRRAKLGGDVQGPTALCCVFACFRNIFQVTCEVVIRCACELLDITRFIYDLWFTCVEASLSFAHKATMEAARSLRTLEFDWSSWRRVLSLRSQAVQEAGLLRDHFKKRHGLFHSYILDWEHHIGQSNCRDMSFQGCKRYCVND